MLSSNGDPSAVIHQEASRRWFTQPQTVMKALNLSPLTSLVLKLVGIVLILSYLLDFVVFLVSALIAGKFQDNAWLLAFTTQVVERGFVPLVGIACLFVGCWIEGTLASETPPKGGLMFASLWLASVLGLIFLLLVPLNINATRVAVEDQMKQVTQEADKAETQINAQVQQLKGQVDAQLNMLDQAIKSGQAQGEQLAQAKRQQEQLQRLKADPKALDAQVAPDRERALSQIRNRKKELESQANESALRSGMRIGLNGVLLAIAYAVIGWTGLRQMLFLREQRQSIG